MHDDSSTVLVPLTRGKFALIDAEDAERILAYNWFATPGDYVFYAARQRHLSDGPGPKTIRMHRVIIDAPKGVRVDHANGNGLDNRRSNLRLASPSQNTMNGRLRSDNTSGFKGVTYHRYHRKWHAQVFLDGKNYHGGYFLTAEDAARAYDEMALSMHGEFARLNFPPGS